MPDTAHRKRAYSALRQQVAEVINNLDPIGLLSIGAPRDEYEPEVDTILPRLKDADSPEAIVELVHGEFVRWFDADTAGPKSRYASVGEPIWRAWCEFRDQAA